MTLHARNREFLSAPSSACPYHPAPIGSRHAFTEAVLISSFSLRGLKCTFHRYSILGRKDRNVFQPIHISDTFASPNVPSFWPAGQSIWQQLKKKTYPKRNLTKNHSEKLSGFSSLLAPINGNFSLEWSFWSVRAAPGSFSQS